MGCLPDRLVDWDAIYSAVQPHATFAAGVLFGLAWWIWGDAQLYSMSTGRSSFSPLSLLPGLVATAAVVLMNFVSREDVIADGLDDAATMRAKLLLLMSYLVSLGAIVGAVVLLVQAKQGKNDMWVGASGVLQSCLVVASGLICWFFHHGEPALGGYGYL